MVRLKLWGLILFEAVTTVSTESRFQEQKHLADDTSNDSRGISQSQLQDWKQGCKEHRIGSDEMVAGDVHFGPRKHDEHPTIGKLSGINSTSWEQWVFDSVSDNGSSGIFLSLGRDASYSFFGQGNLHVEFYALLADGTKIQELAFVDESSIYDCGDFVASTWTSDSHSFEFRVPRETEIGASTTFSVRTPKFHGSFLLAGSAPGHFPDGTLHASPRSSTQVAAGLHMHGTVPAAQVRGNLTIKGRRGGPVSYSGMGGHFHLWAIDNWFKIIWGFRIIRGTAGPYSFFYWEPTSRVGGRTPHYTAILFKNGQKLVSTQASGPPINEPPDGDYVKVLATQHGRGARASVAGRSTGHIVEFSSAGKQWRFELEHQYVQVQMPFGRDTGLAVFTNRVFGGETGGCQYLGSAFSEEAEFPEELARWKIWLVYGVGMMGQMKARAETWLADLGF
ncbi:hypothetical protein CGMCC3_g12996 [Colletotrichum fructicola]|uniref:Diels-Alderase ccsF n=1 Tax=Colletotrichum fructicola (strain Nara gc5) TaxID=1213859 RepID=A0A7J6IWY0_COLFN|nr:uncharacterized protein CGMCC3_g12996 [Colletotrichum fructicola]KAE9570801.1 hypothetical protein CGMCC3_g12996 [Colletotrichum fructicola]KAF4412717.1 Diels-Alderase ccsF [Colletotrichum fructicola]KAF4481299.1 Diels-Alderase ccsF [Colletotrichum fructicola Nara gc5]KAF4896670.1 Diels-Alderase ccsF [Colletotrichum fructicola]